VPIIRLYKCDVCFREQASISGWFLVRKLDAFSMQVSKMVQSDSERNLASNERILCDSSDMSCLIRIMSKELQGRES